MDTFLANFGLEDVWWLPPAITAAIFVLSLILAATVHKMLFPIVVRLTQWTPTNLDSRIVQSIRIPITLGILVLGSYIALTLPLELNQGQLHSIGLVITLLIIILGIITAASVTSSIFDWYIENVASRTPQGFASRLLPLFRRISMTLVYGLGALLVLDQLDINISPLIAGLGLGGLAVALAIQPTLSNLFAGTYVMTEGVITPGDYIELENGIAGYVIDVGWRSTRIRTFYNNMVVVPNSRFAETIITNYQRPTPSMNVMVTCGVSYDSDLYQVENVCREVLDKLLSTNPNSVKEFGGWFGYANFDESNINFWLFLQAKDRPASFALKTTLMQQLHLRLKEENIVINYPVRTLQFPKEWTAETAIREGLKGRQIVRSPSQEIPDEQVESNS